MEGCGGFGGAGRGGGRGGFRGRWGFGGFGEGCGRGRGLVMGDGEKASECGGSRERERPKEGEHRWVERWWHCCSLTSEVNTLNFRTRSQTNSALFLRCSSNAE